MNADEIISTLDLIPHPEGGYYRQTWVAENKGRPTGTAIYFLLKANEKSHWHKVDATEIWLYHAGAPIELRLSESDDGPSTKVTLGPDLSKSERPQVIVPEYWWQSAATTGDWTLVSCTVCPGFQFEGFTLADANFEIPSNTD